MEYLVKLITPVGGVVLDPFMGSGSTLVAAKAKEFQYVGIERELTYHAIAEKRVAETDIEKDYFDLMESLEEESSENTDCLDMMDGLDE
jgi:site-specific DNA-methyltransferase (adenine-specific)